MEFLASLHDALPWYLQLTGSERLREFLADWGARQGIVRGDDWTQVFPWLFRWLAVLAFAWGFGAALLVTKRSSRGRFRGDPDKIRDAVFTGVLRFATGLAIAAVVVLVLFVAAAIGPGPLLWAGAAALVAWLVRRALRSRRSAPVERREDAPAPRRRGPRAGSRR